MSSLFKASDIKSKVTCEGRYKSTSIKRTKIRYLQQLGKRFDNCKNVIGPIEMGYDIHYTSAGEWSTHDLIFHLLNQTGPAYLYFATWSMTELSVRKIIDALDQKTILNIHAILDWRVRVRTPESYEMAKYNLSNIRLTTCHAKVSVLQNEKWSIAIVGSANYTNNPRIESGVISCDKQIADFHIKWIKDVITKSDPFELKKKC